MSFLQEMLYRTSAFINSNTKADRKRYGQFFTPGSVAIFMASLFNIDMGKSSLRILDAGAGSGILSVALLHKIREDGYTGAIKLVCYENDKNILSLLTKNLSAIKDVNFTFEIHQKNYITSQNFGKDPSLFEQNASETYDLIIGNPPYMKIPKEASEAKHMKEICYGAPNLYFLFWAMGIHNLKEGGELVYIIPRSWTSGAYFDSFRKYLLTHCIITDIHLFESRKKVFSGESILQETMIIKIKKDSRKPKKIRITTSNHSDFQTLKHFDANYNMVVGQNNYIYLVTNEAEVEVLSTIEKQPYTLVSDNLRMKTGLIVDFRTKDVLRNEPANDTYPLFYSQHIKDGKVVWPIGQTHEFINTDCKSYLQENANYLFVKRFTAKEEKRRLQCGIYLSSDYPKYKYISTQNKLNYIKCSSQEEVYGLYVLLNSTLYDQYYRILNGSTQVNATEINNMPVPSKEIICNMGKELKKTDLSQTACDSILRKWIN